MVIVFGIVSLSSVCQNSYKLQIITIDSTLSLKEKESLFKIPKLIPEGEIKSQLHEILLSLYSNGYITASIDSIKKDTTIVYAYLKAGKIYKWLSLSTHSKDEEVLSKVGYGDVIYRNQIFSNKQFTTLADRILNYYENNGYPFAVVKLDSISIDNQFVKGYLNIDKKNKITIDSLIIKGNAKISAHYLYRYLGIKPGSLYNEAAVRLISTRIKSLIFVKEAKSYEIYFNSKSADIVLYLDQKKASRINAIAGILPSETEAGKWQFTGDAEVKLINAISKGETVNINWKSLSSRTQELNSFLEIPYLFKSPFGTELNLGIFIKDTLYRTIDIGGGIQYYFNGHNYIKTTIQNTTSAMVSTSGLQNLTSLPSYADFSSTLYGSGVKIEQLDYRYNPRKGILVNVNIGAGQKIIKKNVAINPELYEGIELKSKQIKITGKIDSYIPIWRRHIMNFGLNGGYIESPTIFENELFRIGGLNTLRGFDDQSILASAFTIVTLEYRYLLEQNSYINAFFNAAYYENTSMGNRIYDTPYGFGTGISFETKAGIVKINYALGKQLDNPILLRSGKIHVGLVGQF